MRPTIDDIYRRYFPLVQAKSARVLGDREEARDVAQETIVRLWQADLDDEPQQVTAWLYRTATRLAIDRLRQRTARSDNLDEETMVHATRADQSIHARRLLERVARDVPRKELEVALLHRVDRLNQSEIGELLSMTDRTVRRILQRFDERLARLGLGDDP